MLRPKEQREFRNAGFILTLGGTGGVIASSILATLGESMQNAFHDGVGHVAGEALDAISKPIVVLSGIGFAIGLMAFVASAISSAERRTRKYRNRGSAQ